MSTGKKKQKPKSKSAQVDQFDFSLSKEHRAEAEQLLNKISLLCSGELGSVVIAALGGVMRTVVYQYPDQLPGIMNAFNRSFNSTVILGGNDSMKTVQ